MGAMPHRLLPVLGLLLAATPVTAQFTSSSTNRPDADCRGLVLQAAAGIPEGNRHDYRFHGPCKLVQVTGSADYMAGIQTGSGSSVSQVGSVWAEASVRWDRASGRFTEQVKIEGDYTGELNMELKCAADPVVGTPSCVRTAYSNTTGWAGFDGAWQHARPVTAGKTSLAAATAMSNAPKPPAGTPPAHAPPPQQAPKGLSQPKAAGTVIEGEDLVPTAQASGGSVGRQDMAPFGKSWSGGAQLFWGARQAGAQLRLEFPVAVAGRFRVWGTFSQAPDYGAIAASVEGHPVVNFDGYTAAVVRRRIDLGTYQLGAGARELLIGVSGKNRMSRGYYAGLDRLELEPVP